MDCPFCGKEMKEGAIPSGNRLEWVDRSGTEDSWKGIALNGFFGGNVMAFLCPDCRRIVIPVPEIEGVWDKARRKIGAASEKLDIMREQLGERHTQAEQTKKQKEKEKKGKKDPWEL